MLNIADHKFNTTLEGACTIGLIVVVVTYLVHYSIISHSILTTFFAAQLYCTNCILVQRCKVLELVKNLHSFRDQNECKK